MPKAARVIAKRYQLESLIGEGGMASVWRARDLTLERWVAVKLLFARDDRDKERLVRQFVREARIAASVHHRNVIQIVDFGTIEGQQPFMVMELLEGQSLGQRLHGGAPLSLAELVRIASLTLRGLTAVHEAGIIHRDLKPDNVYLTDDGTGGIFPKILDFGISRSVEPRSGRRSALTTREGMIVGTPEYMSPEQARGVRTIDKRTDIYSMGVILYEALTGKLPFFSENIGDLIIQIVTGTAPSVHEVNPAVPSAISRVVAKAMSRSVDDRYPDALAMQTALLAAADSTLDDKLRQSLSDPPPAIGQSGSVPRADVVRLQTLEFGIDEAGPPLAAALAAPPEPPAIELPIELQPGRNKKPLLVALGLATALGVGLFAVQSSGAPSRPEVAAPPAAAAPDSQPSAAGEQPINAGQADTISVSLRKLPKDALVFVDGQPGGGDVLTLPRDGRDRIIKVTAPGMVPWQVVQHASADAAFDVTLIPVQTDARSTPAAETARAAAASHARPRAKKPPSALRRLDF